jgi:hypothetical protein
VEDAGVDIGLALLACHWLVGETVLPDRRRFASREVE